MLSARMAAFEDYTGTANSASKFTSVIVGRRLLFPSTYFCYKAAHNMTPFKVSI
jgi:hypothetical protein